MTQRPTSRLARFAQYTALGLVLALPAMAQELPTEDYWRDEARHQSLKGATITAQTLVRTHQALISRLMRLSYTADASGNSVMPPLLAHFLSKASLETYTGSDAPYLPEAAREWRIRHRICPSPDDPKTFVILSWLDQDGFRGGNSARELQAAPRKYYDIIQGTFDLNSEMGLMTPKGRGGSNQVLQFGYTPYSGAETLVPACAVGTSLSRWADGSVLPDYEVPALLSVLPMPNLALQWRSQFEYRIGQCPPANDPTLTIAVGNLAREVRERRTLVDTAGNPVLTATGAAVPSQLSPWTYDSGCRAPRRQTITMVEACTYQSLGVELKGQRVYLVDTYEAVPPTPYTDPAGIGQEKWIIVPGTTPRLISNGCSGDGTTPRLNITSVDTLISEPMVCSAVYGTPALYPNIPYSLGAISRQRTRTTHTTTFPASSGLEPYSADTYTPWVWGLDSCHRVYQTSTTETGSTGCPAGYNVGSQTQQRTRTDTTTDYANPVHRDSTSISYSDWVITSNSCGVQYSLAEYIAMNRNNPGFWADPNNYSGSDGGGSNSGSDGGGSSGSYIDVDGDGRGDFATVAEAERAGFTGNNGIRGNYDRVTTYNRSSGVQGQVNYSQSNGGNTGGGGGGGQGGCFLTTAVTERRGEADDGPTLTTLRKFRDGYMTALPQGAALIEEYYRDAPRIVATIPADHADWNWIAAQVDAACDAIRANQPDRALQIYSAMVRRLQATWL